MPAFKKLEIETILNYAITNVAVRIKRQSDFLFLDYNDKTFKAETDCTNVWISLSHSPSPNSASASVYSVLIDLDPTQFTDGDYTVYFHDLSTQGINRIYCIAEVSILNGASVRLTPPCQCPTATEIAGRILDGHVASHKISGSMGDWMQQVNTQLQAIQSKLGI